MTSVTTHSDSSFIKTEAVSHNGMVATKDRLATEAGLEILRMGGNAAELLILEKLGHGLPDMSCWYD